MNKQALPSQAPTGSEKALNPRQRSHQRKEAIFKQNPFLEHDGKNIYHMKDVEHMMSGHPVLGVQCVVLQNVCKTRHARDCERGWGINLANS
jgi:hypothetical protein